MLLLKTQLHTAVRNLLRQRAFTLINLVGLTIGLSSVMVLLVMVYQYSTANNQFSNQERLYYVRVKNKEGNFSKATPYPLLEAITRTCQGVQAATHAQTFSNPWIKFGSKEFQEDTRYVEPGFFEVFNYPLLYGNATTALKAKNSIVLSSDLAQRLFGQTNPVGQVVMADDTINLTVTGVLKPVPANTTLQPKVLLTAALLNDSPDFRNIGTWGNHFAEVYLLLKPGADVASINQQLNRLAAANYDAALRSNRLMLAPFSKMVATESGGMVQAIIRGAVGTACFIVLLLLANLVNLNTASMFGRAKEVAIKQMLGSKKWRIVLQFCIENALLLLLAVVLSLCLFRFILLPATSKMFALSGQFSGLSFDMLHDYPLTLLLVLAALVLAVIAGSYPAFHLVSLQVRDVLKGNLLGKTGKQRTRNVLIAVQFTLAVLFTGITLSLNRQVNYMKTASLGFNQQDVAVVPLDLSFKNTAYATAGMDALLQALKANPYVKAVSVTNSLPTAYANDWNGYSEPSTGKNVGFRHADMDAQMLNVCEIQMLEGRNFRDVQDSSENGNIVINETAMHAFGWTSGVGKHLVQRGSTRVLTVIGVTQDFHYLDLTQRIEPLLHYYTKPQVIGQSMLCLRVDQRHAKIIMPQVQKALEAMAPRRPFSYTWLADNVSSQYALLNNILSITNYVALLTMLIAGMGMLGLIALFAKQRVKEIGIRKVLGADVKEILQLFSAQYIRLVLIATVVAVPVTWWMMHIWLRNFAYRAAVSLPLLLLAGIIALALVLGMTVVQSLKSCRANPVKSLRQE